MNRIEFEEFVASEYAVIGEYPWARYPAFEVFRHKENKKWFAVVMTIDKAKLGINEKGMIDVVNLKCDSFAISSLCEGKGIYPAYHMSKQHWISVLLDGSVDSDLIKMLLDVSYALTNHKRKS